MPAEQEVRQIFKRFRKEGWEESSGKGSHVVFQQRRDNGDGAHLEEGGAPRDLSEHRKGGGLEIAPLPGLEDWSVWSVWSVRVSRAAFCVRYDDVVARKTQIDGRISAVCARPLRSAAHKPQ